MLKFFGFVFGAGLSVALFMGLANDATVDEVQSLGERFRGHSAELLTGIRQALQRPQDAPSAVQVLPPPSPPTDTSSDLLPP